MRDPRLYAKKDHLGVLVPLPREFVNTVRTFGLDDLLPGSEYESVYRSSLVKCDIGRAAFDVDWDAITDEAEHEQKLFYLYDYATGRLYDCDEQVG